MTKYFVIILFTIQIWILGSVGKFWGKLLKSKAAQPDVMNDPVYDAHP